AEDGIRGRTVTGVQTCALPISFDSNAGNVRPVRLAPATPSPGVQELIAQVTHIASIAIERAQDEAALKRSAAFLAQGQHLSSTGTFSWRLDTDDIRFSEEANRIFEFDADSRVSLEQIADR